MNMIKRKEITRKKIKQKRKSVLSQIFSTVSKLHFTNTTVLKKFVELVLLQTKRFK